MLHYAPVRSHRLQLTWLLIAFAGVALAGKALAYMVTR